MKRLPDAEFEVMRLIWAHQPPVTTSMIMQHLNARKEWKVQTVVTLLNRLIDRGFVRTEKPGKERLYYPLVEEEEYLKFETNDFLQRYHRNSLKSLVATLIDSNKLTEDDLQELANWLEKKGKEG